MINCEPQWDLIYLEDCLQSLLCWVIIRNEFWTSMCIFLLELACLPLKIAFMHCYGWKWLRQLGWVCAKYCQPHKPIVNPFDSIPWILWAYCIFLSLNHIIPKNPSLKEKQSSLPFSWMVEFKSKLSFVVVLGVVS